LSCTTINDVVSKFVNSCTEVTGQPNTAIYFKNYTQRGGNRGRGNYRGNFRSRNNNYINNDTQYKNGRGNVEVTIETVATRVEATTTITQVMFK